MPSDFQPYMLEVRRSDSLAMPDHRTTVTNDWKTNSIGQSHTLALRSVFPQPGHATVWIDRELVIGREEGCDVRLDNTQVSRRHAAIQRMASVWLLRDLGSKNGMRVNGAPIKTHPLAAGDVVRIGDNVFVIVSAPPKTDLSFRYFSPDFIGGHLHAAALAELRALAPQPVCVVLEGRTGTGKERFARLLHDESGRTGPFLAVNCASYSPTNAAAELFGYKKNAFTGASDGNIGHIRSAENGTLFLDEITELSLEVQAMLLRVLENREVMPLGESRSRTINVRFVAAVQQPLHDLVASGRFRADLRARIEQSIVRLPSLAECREILLDALLSRMSVHGGTSPSLHAGFVEQLCAHDFPLNFRELDTLARRLARQPAGVALKLHDVNLDGGPKLEGSGPEPRRGRSSQVPGREPKPYTDEELEQLRAALKQASGNVAQAAKQLGMTRPRIYRMLKFLESKDV